MTRIASVLVGVVALVATGCASTNNTSFVSSWKSPTAQPLQLPGAKVVAVVMMKNETSRKRAEDRLAQEISAQGAQGVPMYTIMAESGVEDEAKARTALEQANVQGVVVMHPIATETQAYVSGEPGYALYWDGFYAHGWAAPWDGSDTLPNTKTIVSIDTRIYSLRQNQLVWAGQSKTTNPSSIENLVDELATATADQLKKLGLIAN
jgi:hypothetical protein